MAQDFRLVRYFAPASLIAFVVAAAVLGWAFRKFSVDGLLQTQEQANVNLTRILSNDLWPRHFAPLVQSVDDVPAARLREAPELPSLHARVQERMKGSLTFKVKVYDTRGRTVYSTEREQIGEDKSSNAGVVNALRGETTSELVHRNRFSALEGEVLDRDPIQSYIPQYGEQGRIVGVFEVYSDVTHLLDEIGRRQWLVMGVVAAALAALYVVVFAIVGAAQRILLARSDEERALKDLELGRRKSEFITSAAHELRTPMTSIYGFAELLKTRTYDKEAILLSARGQPADFARGKAAGADAYIVKPFSPAHLIGVIESRPARASRPGPPRTPAAELTGTGR